MSNRQAGLAREHVIRSLEALRAVADDQRGRLLTLLIEAPHTATSLAKALGVARTRVYYHLELLAKHRVIRVLDAPANERRMERTYRAVARQYRVDTELVGDDDRRVLGGVRASIVEQAAADLRAAAQRGAAGEAIALVARTHVRLKPARLAALRQALADVVTRFSKPDATGTDVELAIALFSDPTGSRRR